MDQNIKDFQDFLKTSPLGISFAGKSDGISSPEFVSAVNNLQNTIKDKLSKSSDQSDKTLAGSFQIISGDKLTKSLSDVKTIIAKLSSQKENPVIKGVQSVFNSNPFGIKYGGPVDGILNDELKSKLSELEIKISEISGTNVSNKIISNGQLLSDANDLSKTFGLIKAFMNFKNK